MVVRDGAEGMQGMSLFGWGNHFLYVILGCRSIEIAHVDGRPPARRGSLRLDPVVALDAAGQVVAAGREQSAIAKRDRPDVEVRSLTNHPRVLVADFGLYSQVLQSAAKSLVGGWNLTGPSVVLQQEDLIEGGLSPVEVRALIELGETIGGQKVAVRTGRRLEVSEFADLNAVEDGWCNDPGPSG